jgi:soluble lytic murein transglycosylase
MLCPMCFWAGLKMPRIVVLAAVFVLSMTAARAELLTPGDQKVYRAAFAAAHSNDWIAARRIAEGAREPLPAKVLHWLELMRSDGATFADLVAFADTNPDWPLQRSLRERAEDASRDVPDSVLLEYFQRNQPKTPKGRLRLADMLAASAKGEAATDVVRALWLAVDLDPDTERALLERHAFRLRPADHVARLDRLIWAGQRSAAGRLLGLVPEEQRRLADARLSLQSLAPDAQSVVSRVPQSLRADPGLLFEQARRNRRQDRLEDAARIFLGGRKNLERPAAWWAERQILARRLIDDGNDKLAYALLTAPGPGERSAAHADDEFLSGWIAFRRLGKAKTGYDHFTRSFEAAELAIGRARGAYWAGRAAEALGKGDVSRRWFAAAADSETTYYGQLAASRLGHAAIPKFSPEPFVTPDDIDRFDGNELVRIARMLSEIGGDDDIAKPFLLRLEAMAATPAEHKLVATLAETTHHLDVAIAAAKRAGYNGRPLLELSFPVIPIERDGIAEKPLILAIARQESAFDPLAVSNSNARGLMQLEPETAKRVAKSLSLSFSADRLLTDAKFNLMLGSAYLDQMLDRFGGSYVLSLAAYNAGPARVAQWLNEKGDPRSHSVDIVDWIELIPFGETRNYVQHVLENLQIYRLRLGDRERAFTLAQDLRR